MKPLSKYSAVILTLVMCIFFMGSTTFASSPVIAKVDSFKGKAVIMSEAKIIPITQVGQVLKHGDRIQTENGTVKILFDDGAIVKVNAFTSTMIQEQDETIGFAFWKKKRSVRRVTCFIGKLWFKSGMSKRKNFLQTPTAVCGVRGSDGDLGFDGIQTYLNMYHGETDNIGNVLIGFFENPGQHVAEGSDVYKSLQEASEKYNEALGSGDPNDMKEALSMALEAAIEAGEALAENPDDDIAEFGEQMQEEAQELIDQMGPIEGDDDDGDDDDGDDDDDGEGDDDDDGDDDNNDDIFDPCDGAHPCDGDCDGFLSPEELSLCDFNPCDFNGSGEIDTGEEEECMAATNNN